MRAARATGVDSVDPVVMTTSVCLVGMGAVAALGGALGDSVPLAVSGGVAAALGLTVLLAADWVPALPVIVVTLPLPALYAGSVRIPAAAIVTALVLFAWAASRAAVARPVAPSPARRGPVLALFGAIVVAAAFADARAAAAREVINFAVLLGLLMVATDVLLANRRRVHVLARTIAAVAGPAGVLAALQSVGAIPSEFPLRGTPFHRATLGFGWPNELGVFFAVSLPLCWFAFRTAVTPAWRGAAAFGLAAAGVGLIATFSRGAWLAFLLSAAVLLLAGGARLVLRITLAAVAAFALIDLAAGGALTGRLWSLAGDPFVVQRAGLMLVGLLMFLANPLVGVGPGGFIEHLEEYGPGVPWLWDYVGSAHNAYLDIAAEAGVLGLGAFLWFLGAHFRVLLEGARRGRTVTQPRHSSDDAVSPAFRASAAAADAALRRALLWSFAATCLACFTIWPFAHGIGQLIMLIAAMGVVAARSGGGP